MGFHEWFVIGVCAFFAVQYVIYYCVCGYMFHSNETCCDTARKCREKVEHLEAEVEQLSKDVGFPGALIKERVAQ